MPRRHRIVAPGDFLHVGTRGNNRQTIFDDALRLWFVDTLEPIAREFDWTIYAWALMPNHYHLALRVGSAGISDGMQRLNHRFACASNVRHGRINHALGQRFWSRLIRDEAHLMATISYICWNPVRIGKGHHPKDSHWTSYRPAAGLEIPPKCLAFKELYGLYAPEMVDARRLFCGHVASGRGRCQAP